MTTRHSQRKGTGVRARVALAVLAVIGILVAMPFGQALVDQGAIDTGDYADEDGSYWYCWRGYTFMVTAPAIITNLHGGFTGSGTQYIGLYEAPDMDMQGKRADQVLASEELPADERFAAVSIDPVQLLPGQVYLIAQGRASGSGLFFMLDSIDVTALTVGEVHILNWGPADGASFAWGCTGGPELPVQASALGITSGSPHLGFGGLVLSS